MTSKTPRAPRNRVVVALLVVLAVGWVVYEITWHVTRAPAPEIDYGAELVALSASHQPEGEDGYQHLMGNSHALVNIVAGSVVAAGALSSIPTQNSSNAEATIPPTNHSKGRTMLSP